MKDPKKVPRVKFGKKVEVVGPDSDSDDRERKNQKLPQISNWAKNAKARADDLRRRSLVSKLDEPAINSAVERSKAVSEMMRNRVL